MGDECYLNGVVACDNCGADCDCPGDEIFDPERGLNGFQSYVYDFLRKRLNLKSVDVVRIQTDYAGMWLPDWISDPDPDEHFYMMIIVEIKKDANVLGYLERGELKHEKFLGFINVGNGQYTTHYDIWRE